MSISDFSIVNNKTFEKFEFRGVAPVNNKKEQPVTDVPLIGTSSEDTYLFRFFGQSEEITFDFVIYDDNNAVDDNTSTRYEDGVINVDNQIYYLKNDIYISDYDATWTLYNDRYATSGIIGVITNLEFDNEAGGSNFVTGRLTFRRGKLV